MPGHRRGGKASSSSPTCRSIPGSFASQPRREWARGDSGRQQDGVSQSTCLIWLWLGLLGGHCPWMQQGIEGSWAASPCHPPALLLWGGGRAPKLSSAYYSSLASAWSAVGPSGVCRALRTFEVEQNLMSSCHHFFHRANVGQDLLFAFVFPLQ